MTKRIFFDLDGTLIDASLRLYTLFAELAPENTYSYEEYWKIKKRGPTQRDVLSQYFHYTEEQMVQFKETWMRAIEEPDRLKMDKPFKDVPEFLKKLTGKYTLYLVTARQHPERVKAQLHALGLDNYFADILVTQQRESKAALIRSVLSCTASDILVGDTGEDVMAGKELAVQTVAVSSGVVNADVLARYHPDLLCDNVLQMGQKLSLL